MTARSKMILPAYIAPYFIVVALFSATISAYYFNFSCALSKMSKSKRKFTRVLKSSPRIGLRVQRLFILKKITFCYLLSSSFFWDDNCVRTNNRHNSSPAFVIAASFHTFKRKMRKSASCLWKVIIFK